MNLSHRGHSVYASNLTYQVDNLVGVYVDYSNTSSYWKYFGPKWFTRRSDMLGENLDLLVEDYQPYTVIKEPKVAGRKYGEGLSGFFYQVRVS